MAKKNSRCNGLCPCGDTRTPVAVSARILSALATAVARLDRSAEVDGVTFEGTATIHDLESFPVAVAIESDEDGVHYAEIQDGDR